MSEPPSPFPIDDEQYLEALNRGNAFFLRGEFDEALEAFTEAVEHSPDRSLAYYSRCAAYYALGDPAQGDAELKTAERIDRGHAGP
jgi:tetratricopeptide (TPR) repeat protein